MAQQTGKGQQHRQHLKEARQQTLQLGRQQSSGDQLQKSDKPPVEGTPAFPQLEQGAKH
jgi:hypothetical protein